MPEPVKVQARKTRGYEIFLITIPKKYANELGLRKGDILFAEIGEHKGKKALIYYKP